MADMNIGVDVKVNDGGSSKRIGDLKENIIEADKASKSLKAQLREATNQLNAMADAGDTTSVEFRKLQAEAGRLKDQIGDTSAEIDAMAGSTLERVGKGFGKIAKVGLAAFQGIEGGLAMMGVESEDAQQAMVALQGAMAVSSAIEEFGQLGDTLAVLKGSFSGLLAPIMSFASGAEVAAVAEGELAAATGTATIATNLFTAALIATGIGAIVVAIGLLIANFDKVAEAIMWVGEKVMEAYNWFDSLGTGIKVLIGIMFPFIGIIYGVIKALEYFGVIDSKEEAERKKRHVAHMKRVDAELKKQEQQRKARDKSFENGQKQYDRDIKLAEAAGKSTEELEKKKIRASINYQKQKQKELKQEFMWVELMTKSNKFYADMFGKEYIDELGKSLDEIDIYIKDSEAELSALEIKSKKKGDKEDTTKEDKEQIRNNELEAEKKLSDSKKTELQVQIDDIKSSYKEKIDLAKKYNKDTKALEDARDLEITNATNASNKKIEEDNKKKLDDLEKQYDDYLKDLNELDTIQFNKLKEDADKAKAVLDKELSDKLITEEEYNNRLLKLKEDFNKKDENRKSTIADRDKAALLKMGTDTLDGKLKLLEYEKNKELENKELTEQEKLEIQKKYEAQSKDLITQSEDEKRAKMIESVQAAEQAIADIIDAFGSINEDRLNREKSQLDDKHQKELSNLKEGTAEYEAAKKRQAEEDEKLAKRTFEANKKSMLATAIINAALGITSIIAEYPKFDGGVAMVAALISTAVTNAAAIAKIASSKYESSSPGGSGGLGGSGGGSSFTPSTFYNLGQATPPTGGSNSGGTKVYVLEKDITKTQRKVSVIERRSVLGN